MNLLDRLVDRMLGFPAPRTHHLEIERDLRIPMPDGAVLLADRYRPPGTGPMPVTLVRTPYGRRSWNGAVLGAAVARQGFQVVLQSVRGTFGSGGQFDAFRQEQADGLATAEWLRAQPWCDGRLAMGGGSYLGYTQWALASVLEPPLTAMCPGLTASDVTGPHYPGGSFALSGTLSWVSLLARQERAPLGGLLPNPWRTRRFQRAVTHVPLREADLIAAGQRVDTWRDLVEHGADGFWAEADHDKDVAGVTTPVSMVTGWSDPSLPWQLRDFRALANAGRHARITIGPWSHGGLPATAAMLRDQLDWLGTQLLGSTPEPRPTPVRAFLRRADRWLDLPRWPPAEAAATALYLAAPDRLLADRPPDGEPAWFTYDPADPTPEHGETRPDTVVYSGEPLPRELDVVGEPHAEIHLRTDPGHADVFVRLDDVDPEGDSQTVCDGLLRRQPGDRSPAMVPMWPAAYRFRAGHRIRVQIAGGAFPRFARNHGTGEATGGAARMVPCRYAVLPGSRVVLPVLG